MSDFFHIESIGERAGFPHGPKQDTGIDLSLGYLPDHDASGVAFAHIAAVDEHGRVTPSPSKAIDPSDGRVLMEGKVAIFDLDVDPPRFIREVGEFVVSHDDELKYVPQRLI